MTLFLVRGLPGAGKSTLARLLTKNVVSADDYFVVNGVYVYDATRIKNAHQWCQRECVRILQTGEDVAVANTFVCHWELEPYRRMYEEHGCTLVEITVGGEETDENLAARCIHNVPVDTIKRMRLNWQR